MMNQNNKNEFRRLADRCLVLKGEVAKYEANLAIAVGEVVYWIDPVGNGKNVRTDKKAMLVEGFCWREGRKEGAREPTDVEEKALSGRWRVMQEINGLAERLGFLVGNRWVWYWDYGRDRFMVRELVDMDVC